VAAIFAAGVAAGALLDTALPQASAQTPQAAAPVDNAELLELFTADQADRSGDEIDWEAVSARDAARQARVKAMLAADVPRTGADFFHAAMVLQHSSKADDYLLAHELCVIAIGKGFDRARWLAAATEDRFLMSIGRPQRFATQYRSDGPGTPVKLYQVDPEVSDAMRRHFDAPSLKEAQEREAMFNKK
jgi:hypothetical protein